MDVNRSIIPVRIATCLSYPVKVEDERFLWIHVDWSHVPGAYDDDDKNEDEDWSHVLRTQHRGVR